MNRIPRQIIINTIACLITLCLSHSAWTQVIRVLQVQGNVRYSKNHQLVKRGDTLLNPNESFIYTSSSDAIYALVHHKGILTLKLDQKRSGNTKNGELIAYLKNLMPIETTGNLSGRGILLTREDIKRKFENLSVDTSSVLILDELRWAVSRSLVPAENEGFYYIQYEYYGEKINKRLSFTKDSLNTTYLVLDTNLLKIDGVLTSISRLDSAKFCYFSAPTKKSAVLGIHSFSILKRNNIQDALCMILRDSTEDGAQEVTDYLMVAYGFIERENVEWSLRSLSCQL